MKKNFDYICNIIFILLSIFLIAAGYFAIENKFIANIIIVIYFFTGINFIGFITYNKRGNNDELK